LEEEDITNSHNAEKPTWYFLRNRLPVFLICILLSFFFWFLSSLSKQYEHDIEIPIHFSNIPIDKVPINTVPEKIKLNISAQGYTLLKNIIFPPENPLSINLDYLDTLAPYQDQYVLMFEHIKPLFSKKMGSDIEILNFKPDHIWFIFDRIDTRKIPVKPVCKFSFHNQHRLSGSIIVDPDSVIVSGPSSIIDTLSAVYTEEIIVEKLRKPVSIFAKITKPDERINLSHGIAGLYIPVAKYTEEFADVPIYPSVSDIDIQFYPSHCKIFYKVNFVDYYKVSGNSFRIVAETGTGKHARLIVEKKPDFVEIIRIVPPSVEFIISADEQ